jgi:hypothetical protein
MSTTYSEILKRRQDMTEWLIHFTRDRAGVSAREILRIILIEGILRPGFAERVVRGTSREKTIYGPYPAVCFSEQPLDAFLQYLSARANSSAMAGYGILIHKHDVYAAGGLPVIYGLSRVQELPSDDPLYDPRRRLLDPNLISMDEQYRYVAFAPNRDRYPLDWSHEREWRWPSSASQFGNGLFRLGATFVGKNGSFEGRVNAFVRYDSDVAWLQGEIQRAFAEDQIGRFNTQGEDLYHQWLREDWLKRIRNVRVVSLGTVERGLQSGQKKFARVEDLPPETLAPLILI